MSGVLPRTFLGTILFIRLADGVGAHSFFTASHHREATGTLNFLCTFSQSSHESNLVTESLGYFYMRLNGAEPAMAHLHEDSD